MADEALDQSTRELTKELSYTKWLAKINERVRLALECMIVKQDKIPEADWDILKALHGIWFYGESPLYETITVPDTSKSTQPTLFENTSTVTPLEKQQPEVKEQPKILTSHKKRTCHGK
jgi:hypothetical protein